MNQVVEKQQLYPHCMDILKPLQLASHSPEKPLSFFSLVGSGLYPLTKPPLVRTVAGISVSSSDSTHPLRTQTPSHEKLIDKLEFLITKS